MGRKRKNGEGTVRLRKDGRWEGRVVIGYDDQGLPKTKNVLTKTKVECIEKLKALKEAIAPPTPAKIKADMPFGKWVEYWYETYSKPTSRSSTQRNYEIYIQKYIKPRLGSIPPSKLSTKDVQQLCTWMKTEARVDRSDGKTGVSDRQIHNCYSLCCRAPEKAVKENLIAQNPAIGCKLPPIKQEEMKILSREAMQKVLIQAKEENYYELFLLEFATGLRLGELTALQWDDLDLDTGELRIRRQAVTVDSEIIITEPKTKAANCTLILPPQVVTVLKEYKAKVASRWMFPSPKKEDTHLRHTFATNALAYGMDIKTLSTILGHVSSATTLNTYSHVTDEMRQRAAVKIHQGIATAEVTEQEEKPKERAMTAFRARKRWSR